MYTPGELSAANQKYAEPFVGKDVDFTDIYRAFTAGAKWATEKLTKPSPLVESSEVHPSSFVKQGPVRWDIAAKALNPTKEDYEH